MELVDEALNAYVEAKRNFYLRGLRLAEVEGGRFCEAVFRMLEHRTTGKYTPLGRTLSTDAVIQKLGSLPAGSAGDSIRLHIPRALRVVYDIRNKRDAAHLGDGIDPNLQDATLVMGTLDWVLAELVRLEHNVSADDAQRMVETLVTTQAPVIQDFAGFLKVLNPTLGPSDCLLLLLYQRGTEGASLDELRGWIHPRMRTNVRRTLDRLVHDRALAHFDGTRYFISLSGITSVEDRQLYVLPS